MIYSYRCQNNKCNFYNKEIDIIKPMSDYDKEEVRVKCNQIIKRVYRISSYSTFGDGYKS